MNILAWNKETDTAITPEREPLNGEWAFFDYGSGRTAKKQYNEPVEIIEPLSINVEDVTVKINDVVADKFSGMYYANVNDNLNVTGNLKVGGVIRNISFPITLKMPLIRHANGLPTNDEVYINVTVNSGVLEIDGTIPRSGDWKISTERNNDALKVIGADFQLVADDITILA